MQSNLADIIEELGYACMATREEFRETLLNFGVANVTPGNVAKIIGMMIRTLTGLENSGILQKATGNRSNNLENQPQTWNVDIFVDVLKEVTPTLNWLQVIQELDYPGFMVKDPKGLQLIVFAYFKASSSTNFPVQFIYKPWKNSMGQVSECVQSSK